MKKRTLQLLTILACSLSLTACGKETDADAPVADTSFEEVPNTELAEEEKTPEQQPVEEEIAPEGMYRSELTNEWIDVSLKDQRPVAIMVDNESIALPHYGMTQADVVYEIMNSTANGKITRFMALVKDWGSIEQFGSIRSARPTNFLLAAEWNAVLVHDGGPVYINSYVSEPYTNNFSGGFSRIKNGKPTEYTEYVCTGELEKRFASSGYSTTYNQYYEGQNFQFASESNPVDFSIYATASPATVVDLPFPHNKSILTYNADDQLYYYAEYEREHVDPQNGNAQLAFKNIILQSCSYTEYDENGYMIFNVLGSKQAGYYITNGEAIKISWEKSSATSPTIYYDEQGNQITLNTGKTYIGFVPSEDWMELVIE